MSVPTTATEHGICLARGDEIEPGDEVYDLGGEQIHVECNPDD